MKKLFIVLACLASVILTSCGAVNVSGKKYQYQVEGYPLTIEFAENSDKAFYLNSVGTYRTEGSDIIVSGKKEIRLTAKGDKLYIYQFDEEGNQSDVLDKDLIFKLVGASDYFTNVLPGKFMLAENNIPVNFTETEATVGEKKVPYTFDKDTGKYAVEGYEPTSNKTELMENVVKILMDNVLESTASELTYEKGWWLYQRIENNVSDSMVRKYIASFYGRDYNAAKRDDFALNKLMKEKKAEFSKKYWAVDTKENFRIVQFAYFDKYDFDKGEFKIDTDLTLSNMKSTFAGDNHPLEVVLAGYGKDGHGNYGLNEYSDINSEVIFKVPADKAEELSKEKPVLLIVYTVQPIMKSVWRGYFGGNDNYSQYYNIKSAELIRRDTLEPVGKASVRYTW